MANTLTNILDKILAMNLRILRENAIMPRLVNRDYQGDAARQGSTIDIPIPAAQTVSNVTPAPTSSSAATNSPGLVQVTMTNWKKTDFYLTDKEMVEIDRNRHFMPGQMRQSAIALANDSDDAILAEYKGVYGYVGTAGVTPFSSIATATDARKVLNQQFAPVDEQRFMVLDPTSEGQALQLAAYSNLEQTGDPEVKINGRLGRKFGFDHYMDQNIPTHTTGTASALAAVVGSTTAAGSSTLGITGAASVAIGTLVVGDVFTIAGDSQAYVVKGSDVTLVSALTQQAVTISPPLAQIASATAQITKKASHAVNLAFHRDAFVYVSRPLERPISSELAGGNAMSMITDPLTGISLRLEIIRQAKQDAFELDILHGEKLVLPALATRIAG